MDYSSVKISVIGCGAFGRLILELLVPLTEIIAFDIDHNAVRDHPWPVAMDFPSAACADIVILAVPVQALEETLVRIAPYVRPGCLVIDVCSIKQRPIALMKNALPDYCEILGTHPLFGPQSAVGGVKGSRVALVPVRGAQWRGVANFLRKKLGLHVVLTSAERHDQDMAYVQGLTHMLARVAGAMNLPHTRLGTKTYHHMLEMTRLVGRDSNALFEAIMAENPYSSAVYDEFVETFNWLREMMQGFEAVDWTTQVECNL